MKVFFLCALALVSLNANAASVAYNAKKLASLFEGASTYDVHASAPKSMLVNYLKTKYKGDDELVHRYKLVAHADRLVTDQPVAGTLKNKAAYGEVLSALKEIFHSRERDASYPAVAEKVREAMTDMISEGVVFGFDGFEQSGCAAPAPYLLILDREGQKVFGIDLAPCHES